MPEPTVQRPRDRHHRGRQDNPAAGAGTPTPSNEPVLVLDDCEELDLDGPLREFVPLRRGDSAESSREAVARALRDSPRRLVFANVCPPEAGEVLRALGGGRHHGRLLAIGAPSAETALRQLATWSLADGFSWEAACAAIPTAIDVVVRLDREASSSRRAAEVCRVEAGAGGWALRPACAGRHFERFRDEVVGRIPHRGGVLRVGEVLGWVARFRDDDRAREAVSRPEDDGPE